jgi:MFS family permease
MLIFSLTVFLGALLLFQVELIIGKYILPWFGGASAIWITCMLFFQAALLAGYAYGHVLDRAGARAQSRVHRVFLFASVLVLAAQAILWHSPLTLDSRWKPGAQGNPVIQIFVLLIVSAGFPYFVLAATAPLLQTWWRRIYPGRSPYRLYAVSNFGSFLGLVSYPFLVEPFLTLRAQARIWTCAYIAFALGCAYCALQAAKACKPGTDSAQPEQPPNEAAGSPAIARPSNGLLILWLGLAACASALFLGTTNQLCKNVAAVPLLWVLPLAIYLLTFTLCFESDHRYSRKWFHPAFALAVLLAVFVLSTGARTNLFAQVGIYLFVLFAGCMVCHGEMARLKPDPRHLTLFYLVVAAGGVVGGLFVGLFAPAFFVGYWEYHVSLWFAVLLFLITLYRDKRSWLYSTRVKAPLVLLAAASLLPECMALAVSVQKFLSALPFVGAILLGIYLVQGKRRDENERNNEIVTLVSCSIVMLILAVQFTMLGSASLGKFTSVRDFYSALTVDMQNVSDPDWQAYALRHGEIVHGYQFLDAGKKGIPTSYYAEDGGLGLVLSQHLDPQGVPAPAEHLRIGAVGLGIGTVAAYGRPGDSIRFYEIDPQVVHLAKDTRYFHFLKDCPANLDIVLGDARLSLERELQEGSPQNFDVLVIDAFNGDAIPVHLLTQEAFQVYLQHLKNPTGVLAVHVTNTFLDLRPVVIAAAEHMGLASVAVHADLEGHISYASDWVLVSRDQTLIDSIAARAKHSKKLQVPEKRRWTDDYSNLFQALAAPSASR